MLIDSFIEESNRAGSSEELFALYLAKMRALGFDRIIFSLLSDHATIGYRACHGIVRNYPSDWMSYYMEAGYVDVDPVRKQILAADRPFYWSELPRHRPLTRSESAVMEGGREAGLHAGIGIPLRGAAGAVAGIGAASSAPCADAGLATLCKANLLSQQFYMAYLSSCAPRAARPPVSLTDKQRAILEWAAAGKTKSEIGVILSLSPHTVDYHVRKISRKLDAPNLTVALLTAIKLNLIQV